MAKQVTEGQWQRDLGFATLYAIFLILSLSLLHATKQTAVIWPVGGFLLGCLVLAPTSQWVRLLLVALAITLPLELLWLG